MHRNLAMKPTSWNKNNDNGPDKGKEPGAFFRVLLLLAGIITLTSFFLGEPRDPWPALSVLGMVYISISMYLGLNSEKVVKLTGSRSAYRVNCLVLCGVKGVPMLALGFVCMLNELGHLSLY